MNALDEVFELLGRERRRYALYYLRQRDGPVTVEELAEAIAEWERDDAEHGPEDERFEEVVLSLNHAHLPKIESADSIEYDRENDRVRIADTAGKAEIFISIAERLERPGDDIDSLDVDALLESIYSSGCN